MPAAVIPIGKSSRPDVYDGKTLFEVRTGRRGHWWLLELAPAGCDPTPYGILLVDGETDEFSLRCRSAAEMEELCGLEEQEFDILNYLEADLHRKASEQGAGALLVLLEDTLSNFLRVGDRTAIAYTGSPQGAADRLFDRFVDPEIRRFGTHLPLYGLRAAATKFGEGMATGEAAGDNETWVRVPGLKLTPAMFVAHVVGRSMEPLIPDDSLCVFRSGVTGTRQGKYLLIEKFDENDFAGRYTVKRYTSQKRQKRGESEEEAEAAWEHTSIRLEPLNRDFEAFELSPDRFRVIAEFVAVLGPASDAP